jgi:hypothetical protein
MRRTLVVAAVACLAAGCAGDAGGGDGEDTGLTGGMAHLEFTGDLTETHDLPLDDVDATPVYESLSGQMDLEWNYPTDQDAPEGGEGSLHISGTLFTGTRPTSQDLAISVAASLDEFFSTEGECEVTISRAEVGALEGSLDCTGLGDGETVDVRGTFSATAGG